MYALRTYVRQLQSLIIEIGVYYFIMIVGNHVYLTLPILYYVRPDPRQICRREVLVLIF